MSNFSINSAFQELLNLAQKRDHTLGNRSYASTAFFEGYAGKAQTQEMESINGLLKDSLNILPEDALRKIVTIAYYGKDDDDTYSDIHAAVREWSKEVLVAKLLEHSDLFRLLLDGKDRLEKEGLSPEKL
jgi:hypothetical protein